MEVQVVGHNGGAQNGDRNVEHVTVFEKLRGRQKAVHHSAKFRPRRQNLHQVAKADRADQQKHDDLQIPESAVLQVKNSQHVQSGQANTPEQGNMEEQVEGDGRATDFCEVAGGDSDLTQQPQGYRRAARIIVAARLGKVLLRYDTQPRGERLQQYGDEIGQ